jgi:hypothetical protein
MKATNTNKRIVASPCVEKTALPGNWSWQVVIADLLHLCNGISDSTLQTQNRPFTSSKKCLYEFHHQYTGKDFEKNNFTPLAMLRKPFYLLL